MASNLLKSYRFRFIPTRAYTKAAPRPIGGSADYEVQTTTTSNGILVASGENDAAIARVAIGYRAGSRNETRSNAGTVQVLKNCIGNSTKNATRFRITTSLQQCGGSISIHADKEALIYTLMGTRKATNKSLEFLAEIATQQAFKSWELADVIGMAKKETDSCSPRLKVLDLVHKAAYRGVGLGNPSCPLSYQLGKLNSETLENYVEEYCTASRMAVVGLGINHDDLVSFVEECLHVEDSDDSVAPSKYKGGELRQDAAGDMAYVAIAGKGASLKNPTEVLAFKVLQKVLGSGPSVKRSSGNSGLIGKAIGEDGPENYRVQCFNFNYTDSGLFGVVISAPGDSIEKVVEVAYQTLKSANIEDEDLAKGLGGMKIGMMMDCENANSAFDNLVRSSVLLGAPKSPHDCREAAEEVSAEDVKSALKKVANSKLSIAAMGNVADVPYTEDIAVC